MCKGCCHEGGCAMHWIVKILVVVGGVNWGLVGLGMLFGGKNWNIVNLLLGSLPTVEAIVYVLVGVAAVMKIFYCCKCKKCVVETPTTSAPQA